MSDELIAETHAGKVAGSRVDGVRRWLGVPYAEAERFAAPGSVAPWAGVRDATRFAPQCPQTFSMSRFMRVDPPDFSERGCLALNIWAPDHEPEQPRPVFLWIHGGAFTMGGSNIYSGAELARRGDVVVVGINYRLGVLGFVDFADALDVPAMPSNIGLRDQIAALAWVQQNIAAFGGDPGKVTIAGESAGSMSVSLLMICRQAWPLFHGAIMQSGALDLIHDRRKASSTAQRYVRLLGLDPGSLDRLRAMDARTLLTVQGQVNAMVKGGIAAAPWFDGDLLPASLEEALAHPHAPVPLIAGVTREEVRLFEVLPGDILPTKWPQLEAMVHGRLAPEAAARVLGAYPHTKQGRRGLATDMFFAVPTRKFAHRHAQEHPTWYYRFDQRHPLLGACHGLDLLFLWPGRGLRVTLARGGRLTGKRRALAERIRDHWAHFVRHGTPEEGWPRYRTEDPKVRLFDRADSVVSNPDGDRMAAWDAAVGAASGGSSRIEGR